MCNSNERLIIEIDKENNEAIYVPCIYNCDVSTLKKTKITCLELEEQLKEGIIIYYKAVKKHDPFGAEYTVTKERFFEYLVKEKMSYDDFDRFPRRKCNLVEEYL